MLIITPNSNGMCYVLCVLTCTKLLRETWKMHHSHINCIMYVVTCSYLCHLCKYYEFICDYDLKLQ